MFDATIMLMKHKVLYLLALVIIAIAGISIKVFYFDAESRVLGYLQVRSTPEATVFIDSQAKGKTPFDQSIKPGTYTIKLIPIATDPESQVSVEMPWQGKATISAYQTTYIRRELRNTEVESTGETLSIKKSPNILSANTGEILIETEPDGAIVSYDGQDMGASSYVVKNVPVGIHEISVYLPRFKRRTIQVRVVPGGYMTVAHFQLGLDIEYDKKFAFAKAFEASKSGSMLPIIDKAPPNPTVTPKIEKVEIVDTETGFLRVRNEGSINGREISQVKPGETYNFVDEQSGWIKIKLTDGKEGWVKGEYVKKLYSQ